MLVQGVRFKIAAKIFVTPRILIPSLVQFLHLLDLVGHLPRERPEPGDDVRDGGGLGLVLHVEALEGGGEGGGVAGGLEAGEGLVERGVRG